MTDSPSSTRHHATRSKLSERLSLDDLDHIILKSGAHNKRALDSLCVSDADLERFRAFIQLGADPRNDCAMWTGPLMWKGYGRFHVGGGSIRAHKFSYMLNSGPISEGMVIDHTCHNIDAACSGGNTCLHRRCVNPYHLEAVTKRGNVMRSPLAPARINAEKTHCPQGHPYSGDNLAVRQSGIRECRACARAEYHRAKARRLAEAVR